MPEDEVEGGDVKAGDPAIPPSEVIDKDSETRGWLSFFLVSVLAGLILVHYMAIFVLEWNGKKDSKVLETAFNASPNRVWPRGICGDIFLYAQTLTLSMAGRVRSTSFFFARRAAKVGEDRCYRDA